MSTDFCVEAILQRSCSSSSLSSQRSPISQRSPNHQSPNEKEPSQSGRRGLKRKCEDEENKGRSKRGRTVFSQSQLGYLESVFAHTPYPDKLLKETIAEKLGLEQQRVHVWFQNRRSKQRKLSGHPAPQITSLPKSLPTTHSVYPKSFIPDATMPVYFPLCSPSSSPSSGSLQRTPSPPTYLPLPSPTGPPQTLTRLTSPPTYLSQPHMPFQTTMSPSHSIATGLTRFAYPRPNTTEQTSCNVSVVSLPSVFHNDHNMMSSQSFVVPKNRVGYY